MVGRATQTRGCDTFFIFYFGKTRCAHGSRHKWPPQGKWLEDTGNTSPPIYKADSSESYPTTNTALLHHTVQEAMNLGLLDPFALAQEYDPACLLNGVSAARLPQERYIKALQSLIF